MFNPNKLKAEMLIKGETCDTLAKALNINKSTLSRKMNNKSEGTLSEIQVFFELFGAEKTTEIFLL